MQFNRGNQREKSNKLQCLKKLKQVLVKNFSGVLGDKNKLFDFMYQMKQGPFLPPPTSHMHPLDDVTGVFTRLIMKTKYVCHSQISPRANFCNNPTMRTKFYY